MIPNSNLVKLQLSDTLNQLIETSPHTASCYIHNILLVYKNLCLEVESFYVTSSSCSSICCNGMKEKSLNLCVLSFPFNIQKCFSISNNGELFPVSYIRTFCIKVRSKNRQTSLFISSLNDNERELIRSDITIAYLFICVVTKTSKNV